MKPSVYFHPFRMALCLHLRPTMTNALGKAAVALGLVIIIQSCGASNSPDSSGAPGSPSTRQASPQPLGPSFTSLSQNIFTPKCVTCHSGSNPPGNTDLSQYETIVHNSRHADLVVPGKPENSHLFEVLHSGEMPPNGPALSAEEIQAVSGWISGGALNN